MAQFHRTISHASAFTWLLALVFATAFGTAIYTASEALEERNVAIAVTDLRVAFLTVAEYSAAEATTDREPLQRAIVTLDTSLETALRAFNGDDQATIEAEVRLTKTHGEQLLLGEPMAHEAHSLASHAALERLLRTRSLASTTDASTAERQAEFAAITAIGALLLLGVNRLRRRGERQRDEALATAERVVERRLAAILDASDNAIVAFDSEGATTYCSPRFADSFAEPHQVATWTADLVKEDGAAVDLDALRLAATTAPLRVRRDHDNGRTMSEFDIRVRDHSHDPAIGCYIATFVDITEVNEASRALAKLAHQDPLTELANRRALMQRLRATNGTSRSLLMIDLDDFKGINDRHGHDMGDALLTAVADRFLAACGDHELFRLGGDEFAVLALVDDPDVASAIGTDLAAAMDAPIDLPSGREELSASVGVVCDPDGVSTPTGLLRRADIALYAAKADDARRCRLLVPELEAVSDRRRQVNRALQALVADLELRLVYQPIIDVEQGEPRLVEALLRWEHPELGNVPPDVFIPLAERNGQIQQIGRWVLEHAVADFKAWEDEFSPDVSLTVNVSPRELTDPTFAVNTLSVLADYGVSPNRLVLEVTETALVGQDRGPVEQLEELRRAGCRVACDDFGAGYSNLGQLMTLPLDIIKVDRDLLVHLSEMRDAAGGDPTEPCTIMSAIVDIGNAMHAPIVAEGVETLEHVQSLTRSNVRYLQGYHFSRPLSAAELVDWWRHHRVATVPALSAG